MSQLQLVMTTVLCGIEWEKGGEVVMTDQRDDETCGKGGGCPEDLETVISLFAVYLMMRRVGVCGQESVNCCQERTGRKGATCERGRVDLSETGRGEAVAKEGGKEKEFDDVMMCEGTWSEDKKDKWW